MNKLLILSGKQLSRKARKQSSLIAKARIHVERAMLEFRILQGNIALAAAKNMDQEVAICAALCNLLPPLAK